MPKAKSSTCHGSGLRSLTSLPRCGSSHDMALQRRRYIGHRGPIKTRHVPTAARHLPTKLTPLPRSASLGTLGH